MFLPLISLSLITLLNPTTVDQSTMSANSDLCRITCTITVVDEQSGNAIAFSATAGGIFTSCENAMEKACERAREAADAAFDQQPGE